MGFKQGKLIGFSYWLEAMEIKDNIFLNQSDLIRKQESKDENQKWTEITWAGACPQQEWHCSAWYHICQ